MAMQMGALRDALMSPGDAVKASLAAEEVAGYESQFTSIKLEVSAVRGDLTLLKWMVGTNLTLTLLLAGTVFAVWSKLGEVSGQVATLAARIH